MGFIGSIINHKWQKNRPTRLNFSKILRLVLIAILYLCTFCLLDLFSQKFQIYPGVVAWYPPDGVSLAFLLTFGLGFTPMVALASIISSLIVYKINTPLAPIFVWAAILSVAYAISARILRRRVSNNLRMSNMRNTLVWVISSAAITTFLAIISVSNLVQYGTVPAAQAFDATFQWWIGEMIGLLVFTPFLLVYIMPWLKRFSEGKRVFLAKRKIHFKPNLESIAQIVSMLIVLYIVFGFPPLQKIHLHFLIAVPLIWVAIRHGFSRVSLAIVLTNFGVMLAIWMFKFQQTQLGEFQFLMFGIFFCVLLLGAIVTKQKEGEEELHKKEILNSALIENAPDGIILLGADRMIKYRSPSTQRLLGYNKDQHSIKNPALLTHPDDAQALNQLFEDLLRIPGKVVTAEYRIKHLDGSWRWVESTFTNQVDNPILQAVVVNFRDITERKLSDEALRQSEMRFRSLIEQSQEEISLLTADGTLIYESPTTRRPLGYPPNALVGGKLFELFHPDEREEVINLYQTVVQNPGMVKKALFRFKHQNGSYRWMEGYLSNLLAEPAVQSVVINYTDVTERIEKEQEIEVLAKIPSESPNPVMRMNLDGILLYANETSKDIIDLWKCKTGDQVPKYMADIAVVAFARKENISVEIRCEDKVFSITVTPIIETGYINLYGRDITKRVRAEESLKVSNEELSMLFQLSHSLAEADNLGHIFDIVNRHTVESMHSTYARIALLENDSFVLKAAFPIGVITKEFRLGEWIPVSSLPCSQFILNQNEPRVLLDSDTNITDVEKEFLFIAGAKSICMVPLRISDSSEESGTQVGLLIFGEAGSEGKQLYSPEKLRLAQTIGDSAAIAIRRMLLREQTEDRMQQLVALSEIDLAIISNSDMGYRLEVVCRQVLERLKVDAADIWIYNPIKEKLTFSSCCGFLTSSFASAKPVKLDEGMIGQVVLKRQIIHLSNITEQNKNPRLAKALTNEQFVGYYAVPLIANNEVKGVLEVFHRTELEGNPEWLKFLQILANQAAIAIDNSLLFNDLEQSNIELFQAYDATIQGWSHALDLRDNETEGHTQRVTELTMKLARMFGLPEEELVHIRRGALLHDIGKMGVPDRILLKPGPLTDEEWVIMRQHTTFAYNLISPIAFLTPALDIPLCHHEKWDGTGYPRGLAGEQIPFSARIFSVVDVWDALTSDRPYRAAWPEEKVLEYIRSLAGTQFDPQVVSVCLEPGFLTGSSRQRSGMEQMQWSEHYSVGIKEMDLQHQKLIGMINRLISVSGTQYIHSETVISLLEEMDRYVKVHFVAEERLMVTYGYQLLEEHKIQHLDFETRINEFYYLLNYDVKETADALLSYLTSWWSHHILEADMAYKDFFTEKGLV